MASAYRWTVQSLLLGLLVVATAQTQRTLPKPSPNHPGNVFIAGQQVVVAMPTTNGETGNTWRLLNYEGDAVAQGNATNGQANLGNLPVGYYELRRLSNGFADKPLATVGVLSPLLSPTPGISPIGVDVAMSWHCSEAQRESVANLCALAGINWVRDRLSWREMEPKQGQFAAINKYDDTARAFAQAGLQVLQVHHDSPPWASTNRIRLPPDLRDAYRFCREIARRWRNQVSAFEPWNEGDIEPFGGHTGAELAAFQKASYLGLKAGNSNVIVCQSAFASPQPNVLADIEANCAWPYFDTLNLHHYCPFDEYPSVYAVFRTVSGGRPMWVTECNVPVQWTGDESKAEPSEQDLRIQAERVAKVFASSLYEGSAASFYFMLPHFPEDQKQYGLLHKDLSPRPGYLALAAVGRMLADAKPLGRLRTGASVRAYAFRSQPDGVERDVIVAWSSGNQGVLQLPTTPLAVFDHLGRSLTNATPTLNISTAPIFAVCKKDAFKGAPLELSPARPNWKSGEPSSVVLQILVAKDRVVSSLSALACSSQKPESVPMFVYNFSSQTVTGSLSATVPEGWSATLPRRVELSPGERKEMTLTFDARGATTTPADSVRIRGDFGGAGVAIASLRLSPQPYTLLDAPALPVSHAEDPDRWQPISARNSDSKISKADDSGVAFTVRFAADERWVYPALVLGDGDRPTNGCVALGVTLTATEGQANFRVIFEEDNQSSYFADFFPQPKPGESVEALALLKTATFGNGWSPPDDNGQLDVEKIRTIRIGCNPKGETVSYTIKNVRWLKPKATAQ